MVVDLDVLQGGVYDLIVVRETVELQALQVEEHVMSHLYREREREREVKVYGGSKVTLQFVRERACV